MTLGGLALAVGILVDDATVEIENIHRNLGQGKPIIRAILDGAQQIAVPAFVSTLCICIVFVPVIFLTGAARYLFTPLALAVVLAMMASYLLSRTLVPTMVKYLLRGEAGSLPGRVRRDGKTRGHGIVLAHPPRLSTAVSSACANGYRRLLASALAHRKLVARLLRAHRGCLRRSDSVHRHGFLPAGGRRPDPPARARARRHAHRRNRSSISRRWRTPSARSFPPPSCPTSSTTSACPTAASTSPSATAPPSARSTARSWFRSSPGARLDLGLHPRAAPAPEARSFPS